jgi:large subunit ribosomal protein L15
VQLHDLRSPDGARKRAKRVGRGTGSGRGKTSGRGQKGQHARSQGFRLGFEGGQMPLAQRLPKLRGFKNPFKKVFALINLTRLNRFEDGAHVTPQDLYEAGLADPGQEIKVLAAGKLRRRVTVEAHAASEAARAAIEAHGGSVTILESKQKQSAGARKREREKE